MDAGDAVKLMLGGRPVTRASWKGAVIGFGPVEGNQKIPELVMFTPNGRSSTYQLTAEDLQAPDWEAAL